MTSALDLREEDLLSLIRRQAERFGDRTFMTFGDGESMSFADLDRRVAGFRTYLRENDVQRGDRVALMLKNSLFYPVAWLGAVTAGAIAVPVNSRLGELDARYIFDHSGASHLVVDEKTEAVARSAAPQQIRDIFKARSGDAMAELATASDEAGPLHAGLVANVQYTSGTTGFPKGCLLSHRFWQRMGAASAEALEVSEQDTLITSQAHSYIDPQWNVITALQTGAHLVLLDGFHPSIFMRDVARFGVTVFYCLGVMPTLLLKQPPAEHDRQHALRQVGCSGIPAEHHASIEDRWGVPWFEVFGMTETGVNVAVPRGDRERLRGAGCLGRALGHNEISIVDDEDRHLGPGETGEMVIRGLGLMEGYHRDPDATAAFFRYGWGHTGDLCSKDADGLIYYKGRRKEMIRRGGENIAPGEIESALLTHDDVVECAVVSVPDPDLGEEIKAYAVLRTEARVDAEALAVYLLERLARFKVPRYWEFRDGLPHTPSEKVAKAQLEDGRADWMTNTTDLRS